MLEMLAEGHRIIVFHERILPSDLWVVCKVDEFLTISVKTGHSAVSIGYYIDKVDTNGELFIVMIARSQWLRRLLRTGYRFFIRKSSWDWTFEKLPVTRKRELYMEHVVVAK